LLSSLRVLIIFFITTFLFACSAPDQVEEHTNIQEDVPKEFAEFSQLENEYKNFNSVTAINEIVEMENHYFDNKSGEGSPYYGTIWREQAEAELYGGELFNEYRRDIQSKCDSMHCTIYAVKALKAGMGESFNKMQERHEEIWNAREHAGWSIGYLLVKDWGWKAYSIIDKDSDEFEQVKKSFEKSREYPVWRQPNIKLEEMYILGEQDSLIVNLLSENEFAWGFSDQGYHTWITRFEVLKECNWLGAPADKYEIFGSPLFIKTPFLSYKDYKSHVLIVPPKKEET